MDVEFDQLVRDWLVSQRMTATATTYRVSMADFTQWCARRGLDPRAVARRDIDAYRHSLVSAARIGGPLAPATVYRYLATVSSFYKYALLEGSPGVVANPVEHIRRPRVDNESKRQGLTLDEARALLAASVDAGARTAALVHLLLSTGVRVSEACKASTATLGWSDAGDRTIQVIRKGGKSATIPIASPYWAIIAAYLQERKQGPIGPLFMTNRGRMSRQAAWLTVSTLATTVVPHKRISPHSLRHTAATLALDAGQPLQEVQEMLGHESPATTLRYDRARRSRGGAAFQALGAVLMAAPVEDP